MGSFCNSHSCNEGVFLWICSLIAKIILYSIQQTKGSNCQDSIWTVSIVSEWRGTKNGTKYPVTKI